MICPCCDTINKDDAKVCRSCGIRLTGRRSRPEDEERERKYLKAGIGAVAVIAVVLTIVISLLAGIGSGCETNAGQSAINDDVEGTYDDIGSGVSGADALSGSDAVSNTDTGATVTEGGE